LNRLIDPGGLFAGWVGVGVAVVLVLAFELIIPVQPIVFLLAPAIGLLIGVYANFRAQRWRPRSRALANAAWAALVTGISLALLYVVVRFVFVYGDTGSLPSGERLDCRTGPGCGYARWIDLGRADDLAAVGITDSASYEAAVQGELVNTGLVLVVLTVAGGLVGGTWRGVSRPPVEPLAAST
jgi:hypothetical protein